MHRNTEDALIGGPKLSQEFIRDSEHLALTRRKVALGRVGCANPFLVYGRKVSRGETRCNHSTGWGEPVATVQRAPRSRRYRLLPEGYSIGLVS